MANRKKVQKFEYLKKEKYLKNILRAFFVKYKALVHNYVSAFF